MFSVGQFDAIIDDTISDVSLNMVENREIKRWVDRSSMVAPYDRVVTTSGEFHDARVELNAQGYGTIWIKGEVTLPQGNPFSPIFTAPISVRGLGPGATLVRDGLDEEGNPHPCPPGVTATAAGSLVWGSNFEPYSGNWGQTAGSFLMHHAALGRQQNGVLNIAALSALVRGPGVGELTMQDGFDAEYGDWLLIMSEYADPLVPCHDHNLGHINAEMHQIRYKFDSPDGDFFRYGVHDMIVERYDNRTGPNFTSNGTQTFTASASHGLISGQRFHVSASAAGLTINTVYYVRNLAGNQFNISTTPSGSLITASGGPGTTNHTIWFKPRVIKMQMLNDPKSPIIVDNLRFKVKNASGCAPGPTIMTFSRCDGVSIRNCIWDIPDDGSPGPSRINLQFCAHVDFSENLVQRVHSLTAPTDSSSQTYYMLVIGACCNQVQVQNNIIVNVWNHFVTTGGGQVPSARSPQSRYGTPLNCLVSNNIFMVTQKPITGTAEPLANTPVDTHAEGYGYTVSNNLFVAGPAYNPNNANNTSAMTYVQSRSRNTYVLNNVFLSPASRGLISLGASENVFAHNTLIGSYVNVLPYKSQTEDFGLPANNCSVFANTFIRTMATTVGILRQSAAVNIRTGNYNSVVNNTFYDSMGWVLKIDNFFTGGVAKTTGNNHSFIGNTIIGAGPLGGNVGNNHGVISIMGETSSGMTVIPTTASNNIYIAKNKFIGVRLNEGTPGTNTRVINFGGSGSNHWVVGNIFRDCRVDYLVRFTTGSGHRVARNDLVKGLNNNSIDAAALTTSNLRVIGNTLDGYSAGTFGIIGTNQVSLRADAATRNWS